jgi:hypothetical protein
MVSSNANYEHVKSGWSNSCVMLIIEKMSKQSSTHQMHCVNKVKTCINFHINKSKLLREKSPIYIH